MDVVGIARGNIDDHDKELYNLYKKNAPMRRMGLLIAEHLGRGNENIKTIKKKDRDEYKRGFEHVCEEMICVNGKPYWHPDAGLNMCRLLAERMSYAKMESQRKTSRMQCKKNGNKRRRNSNQSSSSSDGAIGSDLRPPYLQPLDADSDSSGFGVSGSQEEAFDQPIPKKKKRSPNTSTKHERPLALLSSYLTSM